MAIGVVFMSLTPGYNADLLTYLFGNILMVSSENLLVLTILDILIICTVFLFYRQFIAISFDQTHSEITGLPVSFFYILLLIIIALTVVILIQIVGLILVIALLTLPASISALFSKSPSGIMFSASGLGFIFTFTGLYVSYEPDLPSGAMIIIISGIAYLLAILIKQLLKKRKQLQKDD